MSGSAKYDVNEFADLTEQEFAEQYLGHKPVTVSQPSDILVAEPSTADFPEEGIDWREYGAVTPVKNQGYPYLVTIYFKNNQENRCVSCYIGHCGSCWAFSVAANIESMWQIRKGQSVELSPQQLVDCDHQSHGCRGGYTKLAYDTVQRMGGLLSYQDYPYVGQQQNGCFLSADGSVGIR